MLKKKHTFIALIFPPKDLEAKLREVISDFDKDNLIPTQFYKMDTVISIILAPIHEYYRPLVSAWSLRRHCKSLILKHKEVFSLLS